MKINYFPLRFLAIFGLCFSLNAVTAFALPCATEKYGISTKRVYPNVSIEGVADFTGDGRADAYGYQLQSNGQYQNVVILPNDGNGMFGDPIIANTTFPISIETGYVSQKFFGGLNAIDLNNDGFRDFVVRSATGPRIFFTLLNNGNNTFTQQGVTIIDDLEWVMDIADINADGRADLITSFTHASGLSAGIFNGLYYRLGESDGDFGSRITISNAEALTAVAARLDSDNLPDLAISYYPGSTGNATHVFKNLGSGIFSAIGSPVTTYAHLTKVGDFNDDGVADLMGLGGFQGLVVWINNGNATFTQSDFQTWPRQVNFSFTITTIDRAYSVDYNNDGKDDILNVQDFRTGTNEIRRASRYSVFVNNGAGGFNRVDVSRPFPGIPANIDADPDFEGVEFASPSGVSNSRPSVTNRSIINSRNPSCVAAATGQTRIADFDGDGASDMVYWFPNNGTWKYASTNGQGTFTWGGSSFGDKPVLGDFDGDGLTDAAVFRDPTGAWWIRKTSDGTAINYAFGLPGDRPVPADYNGDNITDIAVYRPSTGTWYVQYSGTGQFFVLNFGISEDIPLPQDYDGDGKADIAVFRPSLGTWYYVRSSDGSYYAANWGLGSDRPVPADFDSDGKTDLAVFRPSNGFWYILHSSDGNMTFFQLGSSEHNVLVADSNGDGVFEPASRNSLYYNWYASGRPGFDWGFQGSGNVVKFLLPNG